MKSTNILCAAGLGIGLGVASGLVIYGGSRHASGGAAPDRQHEYAASVELPDLKNVHRLSERIYVGSSPDTDAAFAALADAGVRTVLSVDGARPRVELAEAHGLAYVHLPIGYEGITSERSLTIVKAVRDLPGAVYIHCHHGKHRGPAAAAIARIAVDACPAETAIAEMSRAGTDPKYSGLYAAVRTFEPPSAEVLDRMPADFPAVAPVPSLVEAMVAIDARFEHLKLARDSGWSAPPSHPDIDPPHEATMLREAFAELLRSESDRPADFRDWLAEVATAAEALESALHHSPAAELDRAHPASHAFIRVAATCNACHAKHRDLPYSR